MTRLNARMVRDGLHRQGGGKSLSISEEGRRGVIGADWSAHHQFDVSFCHTAFPQTSSPNRFPTVRRALLPQPT